MYLIFKWRILWFIQHLSNQQLSASTGPHAGAEMMVCVALWYPDALIADEDRATMRTTYSLIPQALVICASVHANLCLNRTHVPDLPE